MTDNNPFDLVSMHIRCDFHMGFDSTYDAIDALQLGEIAYLDKKVIFKPLTTERMCDSYTCHFKKWNTTGEGARIRQNLQDGKDVPIYSKNGTYLWTVGCPSCKRRRENQKVGAKQIRPKSPYGDKDI
mgnify:CR=1 FL=1